MSRTERGRDTTMDSVRDLATAVAAHTDWIGSADEAHDLVNEHLKEGTMPASRTDVQQGTYVRDHLVEVAAKVAARIAEDSGEPEDAFDRIADEVVNEYADRHPARVVTPPHVGRMITKARDLLPETGTALDSYTADRVTAYATTAIAELLWARR